MKHYLDPCRPIIVNGEQTILLAWWISDDGVVIEVSGPRSLLLADAEVTELDGSTLRPRGESK